MHAKQHARTCMLKHTNARQQVIEWSVQGSTHAPLEYVADAPALGRALLVPDIGALSSNPRCCLQARLPSQWQLPCVMQGVHTGLWSGNNPKSLPRLPRSCF